jgi:putative ubiquitin-RnfH superfamily antitoxin RatB of RatAB toxin-antitoxin module
MASAEAPGVLRVEVVFSPAAGVVDRTELYLPAPATLADALRASGLLERHPQAAALPAGIWGRVQPSGTPLRDRDRVEVYRPLLVDPKEARRLRYQRQGGRPKVTARSSPR